MFFGHTRWLLCIFLCLIRHLFLLLLLLFLFTLFFLLRLLWNLFGRSLLFLILLRWLLRWLLGGVLGGVLGGRRRGGNRCRFLGILRLILLLSPALLFVAAIAATPPIAAGLLGRIGRITPSTTPLLCRRLSFLLRLLCFRLRSSAFGVGGFHSWQLRGQRATATRVRDGEGWVDGPIVRDVPLGLRWHLPTRHSGVEGPDLVAPDSGSKPPAAHVSAVTVIPEVNQDV
mmetsp:Transcript_19454/g.67801  ORF Transcript_19454/g.67801 Transcript_19454/m.67801 type:complete len:229 (-) Transcript_19454:488-1174(-)